LDLGCGSGRIARELAEHASSWHAIDMDEAAVSACQAAAPAAVVSRADLRTPPFGEAAFDVVLLLGNTLCLLWDVDEAVDAMLQWRKLLRPGGRLILDDVPGDLWPELAEGRWCAGVDDGETQQMVWADDDAVFAVRAGSAVDCDHWTLAAGDRRMRLWSTGAIRLAARASGFAGPTRHPDAGVLVLRPTRDGRPD
jgi:SAM-dependent methyltransferase